MTTGITRIFSITDTLDPVTGVLLDDPERGLICEYVGPRPEGYALSGGTHFFLIRFGRMMLRAPGEDSLTVSAGQACMVPGAKGWTLATSPEISAVCFSASGDAGAARPVVLDPACPPSMTECASTPASLLVSGMPEQADITVSSGAKGQMNAGAWRTTAYRRISIPFPKHEIMYLLEGNLVLTQEDGTRHIFGAGDVFLARKGTVFDWETDGLTKFYLTFTPRAD